MSDLQDALELLRDARKYLVGDSAEMIDEFIKKMEQPIVRVCHDGNPGNPRVENDNVGIMFCKHRRYTLGDEGALDPYEDVDVVNVDGHILTVEQADFVRQEFEDWVPDDDETDQRDEVLTALDERDGDWTTERRLRKNVALIMPLYLYDHSGITISHGSFNDRWDSGQVGWHYMLKEAVDREWSGDLEKARKCMEAELKEYDDYLTGDVWGYEIETRSGEHIDSCWGFFGDLKESGMLDNVEEKYRPLLEAAWENRQ